ncbi:MAG: bifunctional DNA-formamidopyrimidine glycosylase/DNA-(apurinic or apyrimidinic site) lyase [Lentisphaerae bacterium]|nr:bifunctional DNA-formamidopyrimidine glycosylase/DNA-(apurinic or apyrimidinic site) lyase [Lentisphaerota bacterium]
MPELPEVETIGRGLKEYLVGRYIKNVEVFAERLREPLDSLLDKRLPGKKVLDVRRRGRYLIVELEGDLALLMHFGMSGVLKTVPLKQSRAKHEHVIFDLGEGDSLRFECPRRFSLLKLLELAPGAEPAELAKLGVEPLGDEFNADYFCRAAQKRKLSVKEFLMLNEVVTGIGNIYATEALFKVNISPLRPACGITHAEAAKLIDEVKKILKKSIEVGGTTFSDYRQLDGSTGKYVLALDVYGRAGEKCRICQSDLATVKQGGRTTVYCPRCQK